MLGCSAVLHLAASLARRFYQIQGVPMLLGFHVILSAYGFWLPNDPRGSWSDFVWAWELFRYGPATKVDTRASVAHVPHDRESRRAAKRSLKYPPVRFRDDQIATIADGFAVAAAEGNYAIHACAILPDHVHLILGPQERPIGTGCRSPEIESKYGAAARGHPSS